MTNFSIETVKADIKSAIQNNHLTIISTHTGSGKTLCVPQYSYELCGRKVHVLVPRVILATQSSEGANKLVHGGKPVCGYATGRGDKSTPNTKIVYMTEGSFIQRNIQYKISKGDILLVDEVHEQNASTEAILAIAKDMMKKGVKVVLMSATLDIEKYSNSYASDGLSVGVVELHPSEVRKFNYSFEGTENILQTLRERIGQNRTLIGVAGKEEILRMEENLKVAAKAAGIPIFPIHGELELDELQQAVAYTGNCVYIATNVVQSGITLPNLTLGYFSGEGRRIENVKGTKRLTIYNLSQAEMVQWHGRLGRTCDGTILVETNHVEAFARREKMPTAEILRSPLAETVLQFAGLGINIAETQLLNQPPAEAVLDAVKRLDTLGLLKEGDLTMLGEDVLRSPYGLRGGIIETISSQQGWGATGKKIAALLRDGHPFKYSMNHQLMVDFKMSECRYSDLMVWVGVIDAFVNKFGAKVSNLDRAEFEALCLRYSHNPEEGKGGIYKKSMLSLMRQFASIDQEIMDGVLPSKKQIQAAVGAAYADTIIENGILEGNRIQCGDSSIARDENSRKMVGEIIAIQTRVGRTLHIAEGITMI